MGIFDKFPSPFDRIGPFDKLPFLLPSNFKNFKDYCDYDLERTLRNSGIELLESARIRRDFSLPVDRPLPKITIPSEPDCKDLTKIVDGIITEVGDKQEDYTFASYDCGKLATYKKPEFRFYVARKGDNIIKPNCDLVRFGTYLEEIDGETVTLHVCGENRFLDFAVKDVRADTSVNGIKIYASTPSREYSRDYMRAAIKTLRRLS